MTSYYYVIRTAGLYDKSFYCFDVCCRKILCPLLYMLPLLALGWESLNIAKLKVRKILIKVLTIKKSGAKLYSTIYCSLFLLPKTVVCICVQKSPRRQSVGNCRPMQARFYDSVNYIRLCIRLMLYGTCL